MFLIKINKTIIFLLLLTISLRIWHYKQDVNFIKKQIKLDEKINIIVYF